ncbi:DNA-directed RNA polymerase subunit beta [Paenisporosarcina antarctica]|uniref:DNA-directed RNA polymerase subunit beta n=1 Tax=Paenisporosarcina antarctica TaxID=417367 RepID=A0A4P7A2C0_9BACL|nr:DNA-directed RNA polymerase subunit beta [Paenisporosarcina antarctica]QBP42076.1 DNA-directed RNA polymerase subunit beta [Paenisporosarcina antarctica]
MTNDVKDQQQENTPTPSKRQQHKAEKAKVKDEKKTWWVQIRLFPIWLRIILIVALVIGAMAAGLMIGYGYVGDGEPKDALKWETWQHILDILNGKES